MLESLLKTEEFSQARLCPAQIFPAWSEEQFKVKLAPNCPETPTADAHKVWEALPAARL